MIKGHVSRRRRNGFGCSSRTVRLHAREASDSACFEEASFPLMHRLCGAGQAHMEHTCASASALRLPSAARGSCKPNATCLCALDLD